MHDVFVISSWGDRGTKDIWDGKNTKQARAIPRELWSVIVRRLDRTDTTAAIGDLATPPSYRLEALKGDRRGTYSIRVNRHYRITFRFSDGHAHGVRCEDDH